MYTTDLLSIVRVPTFFFLSGLLYSKKDNSFRDYFIRKTKSLFIPYLLLSLLFTLFDPYTYCPQFLVNNLHYPRLSQFCFLGLSNQCQASIEFFLGDILCTAIGISSRATLPLWFVFVLYFVTIAYHWLFVRTNTRRKVMAPIALACFVMANLLCYAGIGDIMKIGPCLMALFFYWFGTVFVQQMKRLETISTLLLFGLSFFLFYVFYILAPTIVKDVSFAIGLFPIEKAITFLLCSFSGMLSFVLLFRLLSQLSIWGFDILKGVLRNIARNSLIILAMHYWALVVFRLFISPYIPNDYQILAAITFVVLICIASIALFRTRLYMFIGGERAKQSLHVCLSIN